MLSRLHSKLAFLSVAEKLKLAVLVVTVLDGPDSIVVSGAIGACFILAPDGNSNSFRQPIGRVSEPPLVLGL